MQYIPLHGHSTFSFLEAIGTVKKIAQRAKKMELPAIAITDYNGMYGAIAFYGLGNDLGFKPIIGAELGFVLDINNHYTLDNIGTICLLAADNNGYHNLMKLASFANTIGIETRPKIDIQTLQSHSEGIIAIMGYEQSRLGKMIINGEQESKTTEIIGQIQKALGKDNVYLEITAQDHKAYTSLEKINPTILALAEKMGISCVVNNNYFHVLKKDRKAREAALAIKDNMKLYDPMRRKPAGKHHIMTADEISEICLANGFSQKQIDGRLSTNIAIADRIQTEIVLGKTYFPNYDTPDDIIQMYEQHKDSLVE